MVKTSMILDGFAFGRCILLLKTRFKYCNHLGGLYEIPQNNFHWDHGGDNRCCECGPGTIDQ